MFVRLLLGALFALSAIGCGETKFGAAKSGTLAKNSVFGEDATGEILQPGQDGDAYRDFLDDQGKEEEADGTVDTLPGEDAAVELMCSDKRSEQSPNLKRAIAESLPTKLVVNGVGCAIAPAKLRDLALDGKITKAEVQANCPASALAAAGGKFVVASVSVNGKTHPFEGKKKLSIVYALNNRTTPEAQIADENCDQKSSPLVVHRASDPSNPRPVELSSIAEGIAFDLLGANNAHNKVRISWFTNHDYYLLALPDARGDVRGIDELFGDNTRGPDGKFADNGYHALAKYDGMSADGMFRLAPADGRIDRRDAVYSRLRLWSDRNFDGAAKRGELITLDRAGVEFIDLDYSLDYAETDAHGNETKMKSVVGYSDGSLDLIFDLWFSHKRPK